MLLPGLITTIIPVYNRPGLLREAVASVLNQTYWPIEIIIVDDGSTDDTPQAIAELVRAHPETIRVVRQRHAGPGMAREAGRQLAKGEFIQYLDSDDLLLPDKFARQTAGLKVYPDCGVAYGKTCFVPLGQEPAFESPWKRTGERIATMFPAFLQSRWWDTSTPLYRRRLVNAAGPWTTLCNEEDWEYDCRVAALGVKLYCCDAFVSVTRSHAEGLSLGGTTDLRKLQDRAQAHVLIYRHARAAGIDHQVPEMRHYARELFLLARQCGAVGLVAESRTLFRLAQQASGVSDHPTWDFRLYGALARLVGWRRAGALACWSDRLR